MEQNTIPHGGHVQNGFIFSNAAPGRSFIAEATGRGLRSFQIDLNGVATKHDLIERLKVALEMPAYVGHNWDALEEAMVDLDASQCEGFLIIVGSGDSLLALPPKEISTFTSILQQARSVWQNDGKQFIITFTSGERLREFLAKSSC